MLLRNCITIWLCSVTVQGVAVYLMYLVRSAYSSDNERSNLNEQYFADLFDVPRPMVTGPFGTLFFPPNDDSYRNNLVKSNVAPVDGKTEDSTQPSPPRSLLSILSGAVGLYLICCFVPLIALCVVVLCVFFRGREQARHLGYRPDLLEAGLQYDQPEPPQMGPLERPAFPRRTWGG